MIDAEACIAAARRRLSDLKAVHSRWVDGRAGKADEDVIREMESIAYSVTMYLDGVPGPYLQPHSLNSAQSAPNQSGEKT